MGQMARDAGVEITAIEDESEWIEKARAIWPEYYDAIGPDGEEIVNKALEVLAAYPGDN